jgi:hypothetical protein
MREWTYSSTILDLRIRWICGQFQAPSLYSRGKSPQYPLIRRLGGTRKWSGRCEIEKRLLPLLAIKPPPFNPWPVDIPNEQAFYTKQVKTQDRQLGRPMDNIKTDLK